MRKLFALSAILAAGGLAYAAVDQAASTDGPDLNVLNKAVALWSSGDPAGFDPLLERLPEAKRERLASLIKSQSPFFTQQLKPMGPPIGIDLVEIKEVGRVLRRYDFISRYKDGWVHWSFSFYRPATEWEFTSYEFDSREDLVYSQCGRSAPIAEGASYSAAKPETSRF